MLKLDISHLDKFISEGEFHSRINDAELANKQLYSKTGAGSDFLGWLEFPEKTTVKEITEINECAIDLASKSDIIVVIGIGGSYLGAKAVIDALSNHFSPFVKNKTKKTPSVLFAGINISEDYHFELLQLLNDYDYSVIVISKSGTTTEPAIAFRLIKEHLYKKYSIKDAQNRIIAVTDKSKGALRKLADTENFKSFTIPDDVGGRFSVLTPVGLLPIAAAGFNIFKLINGALKMQKLLQSEKNVMLNPADLYAVARNLLYNKGKVIEILASYTPSFKFFIQWWIQLFGESEGKNGKGIFPVGADFTADLHSLGQLIQQGYRNIFETVVSFNNSKYLLKVPAENNNLDELNYLAGKRLSEINNLAEKGTMLAHLEGNVPYIKIILDNLDEENLGELIYFFEKSCAVSAYLLGVNPFDQPGVELYKKNMFALLGKPGYKF
jgi:glucose-6-phosphate isomerase